MSNDYDLAPTPYLVMEVLAARYRLGEHSWSFPRYVRPALRTLEERNLVGWKPGFVPNSCLAWLTEQGREYVLSETYVPPLLQRQDHEEL